MSAVNNPLIGVIVSGVSVVEKNIHQGGALASALILLEDQPGNVR
eukprot:CAMPEP_0198533072 /NCGR_PEP_ID=MMETSP1462-20131121/32200_1 /TAXON_ID=1333877 /ORGANISM="Brandtodinium nutriculum, Strain RCC3387" /LENGTH=44 /DNA_ID= /DNA_START= /DNA_END= /DNA_ORIENTATION=